MVKLHYFQYCSNPRCHNAACHEFPEPADRIRSIYAQSYDIWKLAKENKEKVGKAYPYPGSWQKEYGKWICVYCLDCSYKSWLNRESNQAEDRRVKEKQKIYKQTCQEFKKLEEQLKKNGMDICHSCLNKINGGNWRKWIENHQGAFSYNSKLISEKYCYNCEIEKDIKEQEKETKQKQQQHYQELKEEINNDQLGGVLLDTRIDLALSFGEISERQAQELHKLLAKSVKGQESKLKEQEKRELEEENQQNNQEEYDNWREPMAKIEAGEEVDLNQWNLPLRQRQYLEQMIKNRSDNPEQDDSDLIQQLRTEISQLEQQTNKTAEQETELEEKKRKLAELEAKLKELEGKNKDNSSEKPKNDKIGLYGGGVIVGVLLFLLIIILARNRQKKV